MTQTALTEEWVLGPEGTPFYTKRVSIYIYRYIYIYIYCFRHVSLKVTKPEADLKLSCIVVPEHWRDQSLYSLCPRFFRTHCPIRRVLQLPCVFRQSSHYRI